MGANNVESLLHKEITEEIIKAYYTVYNELGFGFLEKVYQNTMVEELKTSGFEVECQKKILVHYKEKIVGEYFADIIVNNKVIEFILLKSVKICWIRFIRVPIKMNNEEEKSPILGSWRNVYALVIGVLVVVIVLLYAFTLYFKWAYQTGSY